MTEPAKPIVWEKQSYKRYSASVGRLSIEVRRVGGQRLTDRHYWIVGEVLGNPFLRRTREVASLDEAKAEAEEAARDAIIDAARALGLEVRRAR